MENLQVVDDRRMEAPTNQEQELYQKEVCMKVDLDKIEQNENSRVIYKEADLTDLMHSMKKDGLLQPVGVRKIGSGKYEAVFGNRRILAAKKLGWADIAVHVVEAASDTDRDILNLVENIQRKNTTLAEDGRMFILLKERGLKESEIAARIGISTNRVHLAIEVVKEVPKEYHRNLVNQKNTGMAGRGGGATLGKVSPLVTQELLRIRNHHKLNRAKFRTLLDKARDGMTLAEARQIAPLLNTGTTIAQAMKIANRTLSVQIQMTVDREEAEKIRKKHECTLQTYLSKVMVEHSGMKTLRGMWDRKDRNQESA